ncbi:hypothetical protein C8R42DRAFT_714223 [Lentinula raphanica]|nr:hypothetical protein C8R42DRAFT_714223 [Lentinula raphanica]
MTREGPRPQDKADTTRRRREHGLGGNPSITDFLQFHVESSLVSCAFASSNGEGQSPNWQDFVGIVLLLFIDSAIGFYEERNAGNAASVTRNGTWSEIESTDLVPGDMVSFKIGGIVPAECRLTETINVSIDQAAITSKSLPTGAPPVNKDDDATGHLQKILAQIRSFCLVSIDIFVLKILVLYPPLHFSYHRGLNNIFVPLIGAIPIALSTVLSVTLAVKLAKHKAIVTVIEELAGATILVPDTIEASVVAALGDLTKARAGIKLLDFKLFNPVDKHRQA